MLALRLTDQGLEEYESWIKQGNMRIVNKINELIANARDTPYSGLGKPKPLLGDLSGKWSRRITNKDRLVYSVKNGVLVVSQCRGHYTDK